MTFADPLLPPALALLAGIVLSKLWNFSPLEIAVLLAVALAATAFSRHRRWYLLLAVLAGGIALERWNRPGPPPELDVPDNSLALLGGCVVEPSVLSEGRDQFVLEIDPGARVRVNFYLREAESPPSLRYGQIVEIRARVRKPRNFGNPGAFDYRGYLARRDIHWTASVPSGERPHILDGRCGSRLSAVLFSIRAGILARIENLYSGDPYTVAILQALLVGESARLQRVWADAYRRTGTYHAIVISGLHATVIAFSVVLILRLFLQRNSARLFAALAVWLYAGVCGWQAPVVRAAAGFTLFAIGGWFYRRSRLLNLLAALAIVFLIADPLQASEASFQFTFLSVLALGALAQPAVESTTSGFLHALRDLADEDKDLHIPPRHAQFRIELRLAIDTLRLFFRVPLPIAATTLPALTAAVIWIFETMLVSAAVQLGLVLPMVLYFHRLSLTALTANLFVTPALTAAVPLGIAAAATGWAWIASLTRLCVDFSRLTAQWHAALEPNLRIPDPPSWLALAFLASLAALAIFRRKWALAPPLFLLALIVWHPFPAAKPAPLELTMLDVGQGDSLLAGFPNGQWILIDGGGIPVFRNQRLRPRMDIGEDVVTPYLLARSIRRVDVVVSTHQHDDHAAGLLALIENFRPRELWAGGTPPGETWRALSAKARQFGVRIRTPRGGERIPFGAAHIDVLAPPPGYLPRNSPSNDDSIVLRIAYGRHAFLLTGDAERASEYAMLPALSRVDVLKVAHHGSKTSSNDPFLDAARPALALISAGKDNLFRHPHPEVLARLHSRRIAALRTDESGSVTILSDGRYLEMRAHRWEHSSPRDPVFDP